MKTYNLYLDESSTHTDNKQVHFAIAGIIVEENYHNDILIPRLNNLKKNIWKQNFPNFSELILHEKDITFALKNKNRKQLNTLPKEYHQFTSIIEARKVYIELEKIIRDKNILVMGACIVEDELYKHYSKDILTDKYRIILQVIFENFCHFLKENNAVGNIFYEEIGEAENKKMSMRLHQIKALGTMYIHPYAMQNLIKNISFPNKKDNIAGLQIADFIPNNIVRFVAKKPKKDLNLYNAINSAKYNGGSLVNKPDKFGIKIIP